MSDSIMVAVLFWVIVAGCFFHVVRTELREWKKRRAARTPKTSGPPASPQIAIGSDPAQCAKCESNDKPLIGADGHPWPRTIDALIWAQEFNRRFDSPDLSTMHGWFANAIMAGYDEAARRAAKGETP